LLGEKKCIISTKFDKCLFFKNLLEKKSSSNRFTCLYNKNKKKTIEFNFEAFLSCPETQVRKSYYWKAHINEDMNLDFMIDGKAISINLQDIKPTCLRKLKKVGKNDI
jgi:hypothetical protein